MITETSKKLEKTIRDVLDFPVKGIVFKDITPVLQDISLFKEVIDGLADKFKDYKIDKIAGVESRGFIFGMPLALKMGIPFIPVRKKGKLPAETVEVTYSLEYGQASIEMHKDAVNSGENVLIIDDLLATGGTTNAAIELIKKLEGNPVAAAFVVELGFLSGRNNISNANQNIEVFSILKY
ncbi:MAG: adenine phosphoribosyltransferase [Endomicrobia bacterium]|nr:adenine phosphoribosyltransferase [Endomicrobiia bacterium]MCL2507494.1 adenine phosphoribosyltransferase [Endomicrobiia bacterium]